MLRQRAYRGREGDFAIKGKPLLAYYWHHFGLSVIGSFPSGWRARKAFSKRPLYRGWRAQPEKTRKASIISVLFDEAYYTTLYPEADGFGQIAH